VAYLYRLYQVKLKIERLSICLLFEAILYIIYYMDKYTTILLTKNDDLLIDNFAKRENLSKTKALAKILHEYFRKDAKKSSTVGEGLSKVLNPTPKKLKRKIDLDNLKSPSTDYLDKLDILNY